MAFNTTLANRIHDALIQTQGITEKKMFGGVCFLLNGNILVGVWKDSLIARVGLEQEKNALAQPYTKEMDITGKPMKGWVLVEPDGTDKDRQLKYWIQLALKFVETLPTK